MGAIYFKRYRMELDLEHPLFALPVLPPNYLLLRWDAALLEAHATAKYMSFRHEIDAHVFPCLGERRGCHRLMTEISQRGGFLSEATWLLIYRDRETGERESVGTIQGLRDAQGTGAVQNLGIVPGHRGKGLGSHLLHRALQGFQEHGLDRVYLEVTAQNEDAIRLYRRLGFRLVRTVYKAGDMAPA